VIDSADGEKSPDGGRDCSAIPHVSSVSCKAGRCLIGMSSSLVTIGFIMIYAIADSCRHGYVKSDDGEECVHI
jgi:hypothetical protein